MKKVCVKTVVVGRSGKSTIRTPLTVDVGSKNQAIPINVDYDSEQEPYGSSDNFFNEEVTIAPDNSAEESTTHKRNISNFCNWEKIRPMLLKASFEDASFPTNDAPMCSVCMNKQACVRCQYCGPRQFFCEECALAFHETRNQFHVMEKWMVI
jgi:hypothetical protein